MAKQEKGVGLLKNLCFAPEARTDGQVSLPIEGGRFRYFWKVFRRRNGALMLINLLFLVTLLPLIALLVVLSALKVEPLSYMLTKTTDASHYFMTSVGLGLSSGASLTAAKLGIFDVYRIAFALAGAAMPFLSIGLAGFMYVSMKFIWNDEFVTKKDSYGNNVPRAVVEFFIGIKKYWWQMLLVGLMLGAVVAGVGNIFIFFLARNLVGRAGAGEWILIVLTSAFTLLFAMFIVHLLPIIVCYDMPFAKKLQNALIMTLQMFVQNIFVVGVLSAPILLFALTNGVFNIIIAALLLVYGAAFYCLSMCNLTQYYAEKIITPVYRERFARTAKAKGKSKK